MKPARSETRHGRLRPTRTVRRLAVRRKSGRRRRSDATRWPPAHGYFQAEGVAIVRRCPGRRAASAVPSRLPLRTGCECLHLPTVSGRLLDPVGARMLRALCGVCPPRVRRARRRGGARTLVPLDATCDAE